MSGHSPGLHRLSSFVRAVYRGLVDPLEEPAGKRNLRLGVPSGFAFPALLGLVAMFAERAQAISSARWVYALVAFKFVLNGALALALRRDRHLGLVAAMNLAADLALMTSAVHLTGGVLSPLAPVYIVEVAIVAAITHVGPTVFAASVAFGMFATSSLLAHHRVIPAQTVPVLGLDPARLTTGEVASVLVLYAILLGVSATFIGGIVGKLRASERALDEKHRALEVASRAKSQLVANVTHELRTPLYGIMGLLDVVDAEIYGPVTREQREAIRSVQGNAEALVELIDALLALARAETAKLTLRPEEVDVHAVVQRVADRARAMIGRRELSVDVHVGAGLEPFFTDREKLLMVLGNLVSNAVKFTRDGGRVEVRAALVEGELELVVSDTGIGIPRDAVARIFEPFEQLDGSASREYGGAGIGLALVRRLVDMMSGTIEVESELGVGSSFRVKLPPCERVSTERLRASA
jgi:signal transduction histidine kinase